MEKLIIVGTSTTARNVCLFVQRYGLFDVAGFAANEAYKSCDTYCGKPVYAIERMSGEGVFDKERDFVFVAMQWNRLNSERRRVCEDLKANGFRMANLIAPNAVTNGTIVGGNHWICEGAIIDFGSVIGEDVFIKIGAKVADNTTIGAHCFVGAGSIIAGGVKIGEQSFIGVGAVVFDCVTIGRKCIVGAATALKRNLPDFTVYKTSSDAFTVKTYSQEEIESKLMFQKNVREPAKVKGGGKPRLNYLPAAHNALARASFYSQDRRSAA